MKSSNRKIDNWMFTINHVDGLEKEAIWLLSYFEEMARNGVSFHNGMKVGLGWSILELRNDSEEIFSVYEPDFSANPFVDVRPDVSVTLQVQASQVALVNHFKLSPVDVSFQDKIIFAKGSMEARKIYLERTAPRPEKGDSGWFVGFVEGDNSPANLQAGFVYQLLSLRPMLLQFLLLPPGLMVVLDEDRVEVILDKEGNPLQ